MDMHQTIEAADGTQLAFRHTPAAASDRGPAIVFLPGYMSDMAGGKATAIFNHCVQTGRECLLMDYSGCGESGGDFADGTLSKWRDEALFLIDHAVEADGVLVIGSSMGGWLMLLVAERLANRLAGMIGIAAAPDFTRWGYDTEQRAALAAGQIVLEDNPYGPEPTPTHPGFFADAEGVLRLENAIDITAPVRLLHGQRDEDVPWDISLKLAAALRSDDVQVNLVKSGDHRLSRDADIAMLLGLIDQIYDGNLPQ